MTRRKSSDYYPAGRPFVCRKCKKSFWFQQEAEECCA